jgi:hypothetical protein
MKPTPEQLSRMPPDVRAEANKRPHSDIEDLHRKVARSPEGRMAAIEQLSQEMDRRFRWLERNAEED